VNGYGQERSIEIRHKTETATPEGMAAHAAHAAGLIGAKTKTATPFGMAASGYTLA
jgi:hypothetical protein